jgi:two-component system, NtrC family, sensor histidine kinase HydH
LRHAETVAQLHGETQSILDHMPSGVVALSEGGQITALNRTMRDRLPSATRGDMLAAAFRRATPSDVDRVSALVADVVRHAGVRSLVAQRLDLFGTEGYYSIHAISLGSLLSAARVIVVIEDLTEVTSLTTQLLHAEKLATVGILAAGIAHEVGTPIGVMRGRAEYLIEKLGAADRDARDAAIIVEQADLVTRIIRQLLDFSRTTPTDIRPVSVATVATTAVELLRIETARRGVVVAAEVPTALPEVAADRDQLQQVLVNLLMNACDASPAGGRIKLCAAVAPADGADRSVRIEVSDEGCGIPERNRHQVFDPFFTTKKRGHGTGLGLTIAAQIVRNHQGQIELESETRRGTRVILHWPTARSGRAAEGADGLIG